VILLPSASGADLWHASALWAAEVKQYLVAGAQGAASQLPAQLPGAILAQAGRAKPRAPDPHLLSLDGVGECDGRRDRGSAKCAAGIAGEQHSLEHVARDPGRERGVLELLGGKRDAVAGSGCEAAGARSSPSALITSPGWNWKVCE
jgi:hypothetical protein